MERDFLWMPEQPEEHCGGHWVAKGVGHEPGGRVYGGGGEGGRRNRKEEDRKEMLTEECRLISVEKFKFKPPL